MGTQRRTEQKLVLDTLHAVEEAIGQDRVIIHLPPIANYQL
jgi:hypothetical protein